MYEEPLVRIEDEENEWFNTCCCVNVKCIAYRRKLEHAKIFFLASAFKYQHTTYDKWRVEK